jgi:hypothetical protein
MLTTLIAPIILLASVAIVGQALMQTTSAWLRSFLVAEIAFNLAIAVGFIVAAVQLFRHKRMFPRLFSALLIASLIGTLADIAIAVGVFDIPLEPSDFRDVARALIGVAIWVPYMEISKRVKNTFVVD